MMTRLYDVFFNENKDKTFNEILGNAKFGVNNTYLIKDVDDYNFNEIKCLVGFHINDVHIEVEVEFLNGKLLFHYVCKCICKYGREWEKIAFFEPQEGVDWKVLSNDDGELWMNNEDGFVIFIEKDGTILFDYI